MASLIYNSAIFDASTGAIDFDTDAFKMMLVTSSYTAAKTHMKRNAVTNGLVVLVTRQVAILLLLRSRRMTQTVV
jgi:hypothetical protein